MRRFPYMPAGMAARLSSLLLLAVAAAACSEEPPAEKPLVCPEGTVADEAGGCVTPAPTCAGGAPGSIRATCEAQFRSCFEPGVGARCGPCLSGFVEEDGTCRPRRSCADLTCAAEYRNCVEGGERADAACGDCIAGVAVEEGACVPYVCDPDAPSSLAASCAQAKRACVEEEGTAARCGGCWAGFIDRSGACDRLYTCASLGCAAAARTCVQETATADADCGGCLAGYVERNGSCVRRSDATCGETSPETTIEPDCWNEHRSCDATATPARCGGCLDGFVEVPELGCVTRVTCAELACELDHRTCEELPTGRCIGCLPGYLEEPATGVCRPIRTCAEVTCPQGEVCFLPGDHEDAACRVDCGDSAIWGGRRCEPCPPCTDAGEEGRWSTPTRAGSCICRTAPGYFYSTAGDVGSFPCDADGDGWVRESARLALESADPALATNARCALRTIDRFVLIDEAGESRDVPLGTPLALYESDRNDDDALLRIHWGNKGLPGYAGALPPRAGELNRLTKLCHDPRVDYNDNGVADVDEWTGYPKSPNVRADQVPFNELAYFAELHNGRYEPSAVSPHGRYVIQEKRRAAGPAGPMGIEHLALAYAPDDGTYWRECKVDRDPAFGTADPAVGLDFAVYSDPAPGFAGMNHHSQFKCLVFENEPTPGAPQEWTPDGAAARGFRLQTCRSAGAPAQPEGTNPALPDIACRPVATIAVRPGDVAWGAVPYDDYGPDLPGASYRGGCVNACIEALPSCPGYSINPLAVACIHEPSDFGKFVSCEAWEICDGRDNDGNGLEDDGNPGGGKACATGRVGICAAGVTNCRGGEIVCDQVTPQGSETCNSLDDDCDGDVDETFPEQGSTCTVSGQQGICAVGTRVCVGGSLLCPQTVFPEAQETCNQKDDDCDGATDEDDNAIGCTDWYLDDDRDGWAVATAKRCMCKSEGKYTQKADKAKDCCDSDNRAYPGVGGWYSSTNNCGSFDWDCDGKQTPEHNAAYSAGCDTCCSGFCCCDAAVGWANAVPPCGQKGTWYKNDCSSWASCRQEWEERLSFCR